MKIKRIISSVILMSAITLGIGIATNNSSTKETAPVEATETTKTLYINHFDGGGSWKDFSYFLFGSGGDNGPFPGESFKDSMKTSTPNEYDQYQYVLTIDTSKYQTLILSGKPSGWESGQAQTNDLLIADMEGNGLYCKEQITDTNKFDVGYYDYSTKTVYLHDLDGSTYATNHYVHTFATGKSGTTWPGVEMTKVSGTNNIYSAEINSALDNVIFNNDDGGKKTDTINGISNNDLFICYPDNGYNRIVKKAAEFIDQYMKFETVWFDNEGNGSCKSAGWYSAAKTAFLYKTNQQKTDILAHEPTKDRLSAWAKANGDTFDPITATFSSARITPILSVAGDNNVMTIVVIISILSITAIGGYFFFRKNRNKEES